MPVLRNIGNLATCRADGGQAEIHAISEAALAWQNGEIRWLGPETNLPFEYGAHESLDAGGRLVVPGLVDCHTHLAFAGWRAGEFEQRILGRSYLEIAEAGGGILSTVRATRAASQEDLYERSRLFLDEMLALGVTTVECKSGYGLSLEEELKQLTVYRRLAEAGPIRIVPTLLAAHVVPPEYREDRAGYVDLVVEEIIPHAAGEGLARCCDVFLEQSAFTREESRRILEAGIDAGLLGKLHADQLTDGGGANLAAEVGAVSADHLECISEEGIQAVAAAGVVAVSLRGHRLQPGLRAQLPPAVRDDPRLQPAADDARRGPQGCDDLRRPGDRAGGSGRVARAGKGCGLRGHRRARRRPLAVSPAAERLRGHRDRRAGHIREPAGLAAGRTYRRPAGSIAA